MRSLALALASVGVVATAASAQITFEPVGSIPIQAENVEIQDGLAYITAARTLSIVDVKTPGAPKLLGSYTFPEEIWAFRLQGQTAYVGVNFFGLGIVDVSNPATPVLRGSHKTPGQAKVGAAWGSRALVIDHMEGVVEVNITNPAKPSSPGTFFLDGYARDVVAQGSMAYAVDSPTGLYIFDLSKPGPLEPVASLQNGTALRTVDAFGDDGPRVVVAMGGGMLQLYDISEPTAPVRLPPYKTPGGAQRVALRGTRAYVADGAAGLTVVNLANPRAPAIVGAYKTPAAARDVAAADGLVVVALANGTVQVLRESNTP
jgi:hypothetical protein